MPVEGKHHSCQYHFTRYHIHSIDYSEHCPITQPSQWPWDSSTEPARKKSHSSWLSLIPTHRTCSQLKSNNSKTIINAQQENDQHKFSHYKSIHYEITHLRPSYQKHINLTMDHYLAYVTRVNNNEDNCQTTTGDLFIQPPDVHNISTFDPVISFLSTASNSSSSKNDKIQACTTLFTTNISSMQLWPRIPISYNENFQETQTLTNLNYKHFCNMDILKNRIDIFSVETSFCQFSNMASSGMKKMFILQCYIHKNVYQKMFSKITFFFFTMADVMSYVRLMLLPI